MENKPVGRPKKDEAVEASVIDLNTRVDNLEKAMGVVMGFFKTVLPADFERYLKKEAKLAERIGIESVRK